MMVAPFWWRPDIPSASKLPQPSALAFYPCRYRRVRIARDGGGKAFVKAILSDEFVPVLRLDDQIPVQRAKCRAPGRSRHYVNWTLPERWGSAGKKPGQQALREQGGRQADRDRDRISDNIGDTGIPADEGQPLAQFDEDPETEQCHAR